MSIPYQPINVVLQTGNGQNLISWDLVPGATSFVVNRSTDGINFTSVGTSTATTYFDAAVTVGTNYFYQVASANSLGTSSFAPTYPVSITPCLPGQINLGYIRYLAQLRADKLDSQYLTTDEWNSNINQSMFELADILTTKFGDDYFLAPPVIIPLTGLDYYPLPNGSNYSGAPAIYKLSGVDVNVSGQYSGINAGWVPLSRFNWSDRDKYTVWPGQVGALFNVNQMGYREMGSNIHLIPANMNQVIRLWYVPISAQLLQDTDMLSFSFSGWSEYIIIDAAMKAMVKEESLEKWSALKGLKDALMERIETTAANRDVGQPNSVSNVRATMGDPGFSNWGGGMGGGSGWFGGGGC